MLDTNAAKPIIAKAKQLTRKPPTKASLLAYKTLFNIK